MPRKVSITSIFYRAVKTLFNQTDWAGYNIPPNTLQVIIGDGFLWVKWPNQQCQSTEGSNHSVFYCSKRWWGGSGISWTICKSFVPRSRQITMPVPHHSVFTARMPVLPPNQHCQSTEGIYYTIIQHIKRNTKYTYTKMNLTTVQWAQWDKTQSKRPVKLFKKLCNYIIYIMLHNTT